MKASDNVFARLILAMRTSNLSAPSDSSWQLFAKADGVYARSSNTVVGPLAAGGAGSGSITASGYTQTTARLLGRTTASTGAIEEITVGSGLSMSAGTLSASGGSFPTHGYDTVTTDQAGVTGSYGDLATAGPAVTVTVNTKVKVTISFDGYDSTSGGATGAMSVTLSSANTSAAADALSLEHAPSAGAGVSASRVIYYSGLTPGSTVFTSKYKATSTNYHYRRREILVECMD